MKISFFLFCSQTEFCRGWIFILISRNLMKKSVSGGTFFAVLHSAHDGWQTGRPGGFELLRWNLKLIRTLIKVRLTFSTATPTPTSHPHLPFHCSGTRWDHKHNLFFDNPPDTHTHRRTPPFLKGLESPHSTPMDNWTPSAWEIPCRNKTGTSSVDSYQVCQI